MNKLILYGSIILLACSGLYFFKNEISQGRDPKADDMSVDHNGAVKSGDNQGEERLDEGQGGEFGGPAIQASHKDLHQEMASGSQKTSEGNDGQAFIYDTEGNLIRENLPNGQVILYTYTESGERISETVDQF